MSMHIISPGMLTTVQDLGRRGYMASGFQQGGAMDQFAARAANILLDNSERDGVLEMTLLGVKAYFDEDNVIAITGAEFAPTVTDSETGEVTELPMKCAVRVKKGDVLDCGSAKSGLRGYLAVAGEPGCLPDLDLGDHAAADESGGSKALLCPVYGVFSDGAGIG